jgi:hypothetical protein
MDAFDRSLLDGLTAFAAVVEAGTFVAAGKELGLTQFGVSRAVQRLESNSFLAQVPNAATTHAVLMCEQQGLRRLWQANKVPCTPASWR